MLCAEDAAAYRQYKRVRESGRVTTAKLSRRNRVIGSYPDATGTARADEDCEALLFHTWALIPAPFGILIALHLPLAGVSVTSYTPRPLNCFDLCCELPLRLPPEPMMTKPHTSVLIVDDDAALREMFTNALRWAGLMKPVAPEELVSAVRRALEGAPQDAT